MEKAVFLFPAVMLFWIVFFGAASAAGALELMSPAFKDGGDMPAKHARPAAGGQNVSIPLQWSGVPEGAKSFALSIIDIHPVANNWVHWLVANIPAGVTSLPEGASGKNMPPGAVEAKNSFGTTGYGGPQPPKGTGSHSYVVTLYALNVDKIDLPASASRSDFQNAIKGKIIQQATITGHYKQ